MCVLYILWTLHTPIAEYLNGIHTLLFAMVIYLSPIYINFKLSIKCQYYENNFVFGGYAGTQLFNGTNVGETIIKRHRCASITRNRASIGFY